MDIGETPLDPTELNTDTLTMEKPAVPGGSEGGIQRRQRALRASRRRLVDATAEDPTLGSGGGFNVMAWGQGAKVTGAGRRPGQGGCGGSGFGGRGSGHREAMSARAAAPSKSEARRGRRPELALAPSR